MKLTELKCPACQGPLTLDNNRPDRAVCEYCGTEYLIEREGDSYGFQDGSRAYTRKIDYTPLKEKERMAAEFEKDKKKQKVSLVIFVVIMVAAAISFLGRGRNKTENGDDYAELNKMIEENQTVGAAIDRETDAGAFTGALAQGLEQFFGRPLETLSTDDFQKIVWLEGEITVDGCKLGLSMENPLNNSEAELTWYTIPGDRNGVVREGISELRGLKYLAVNESVTADALKGLKLEGLSAYISSPGAAAEVLEQPELLKELRLRGSDVTLEGLEELPGLEGLCIESRNFSDTRSLVQAKSLKRLKLDMGDTKINPEDLSVLTSLEELSVKCSDLRDLSFVEKLGQLKSFYIEDGGFLTLDALNKLSQLTELTVLDCDELEDMSAVGNLTGLEALTIEKPYHCPEPDLSGLTNLRSLYLKGFEDTGFLQNMTALETLTLYSCTVSDSTNLSGLTHLKHLTCTAFAASEKDYTFITGFTGLETLNLTGTVTYKDISPLFSMPSLRELKLDGMECELDFDAVPENTVLEKLSMDGMKFYKNVKVQRDGVFTYVDWDDVDIKEHLDFFGKLKGLKELSLEENGLTDISFAEELTSLEVLNIEDNYVTDLSPLSELPSLKQVYCGDNPVSNTRVLPESVMIITE